jgi:hypothetical protein
LIIRALFMHTPPPLIGKRRASGGVSGRQSKSFAIGERGRIPAGTRDDSGVVTRVGLWLRVETISDVEGAEWLSPPAGEEQPAHLVRGKA